MTNEEITDTVERYADMVKRICFTYMKNDHEADDIFQTVFLKLLQSDITFESEEHRKAWLIKVSINSCKDTLKSFFRKNIISMSHLDHEDESNPKRMYETIPDQMTVEEYNRNNSEDFYEEVDYSWVREALMTLPKKYRISLYLFYYEGYSAKEIASILGCGVNTVFTHLKRGREQMKKKIGDEWNE